ncbi:MAG: rhodanese-like domain-containing protein [Sulfurovum sp.]|nr:rhodanese-like domain-containing protein [Sulfurovum sp.]
MIRILSTILVLAPVLLFAEPTPIEKITVKINKDIPYVNAFDGTKAIQVKRIQDPAYKLTDDFTKTSRPCPPFCIQPTSVAKDVKNIAELELLEFIRHDVPKGTGLLIDARLPNWYIIETIPSALNLPFTRVKGSTKASMLEIFKLFGMTVKETGVWDFSTAKKLAIFCNGVWCEQSKHLITGLLKHGYPKELLYYYRSGFQGWKLLGLTTVIHEGKMR